MNFQDLLTKIKHIDEGGIARSPLPIPPAGTVVPGTPAAIAQASGRSLGSVDGTGRPRPHPYSGSSPFEGGEPMEPSKHPQGDDILTGEDNPGMGPYTGGPTSGAKSNVKQSPAELDFKAAQANAATMRTQGDVRKVDAAAAKQADWQKALAADAPVEECGGMMGMPGSPKQSDSVTMNVSMNGSGAGGIKDLIGILRNIEGGGHGHNDPDDVLVGVGEEYANEPNATVSNIAAVTPTGDDASSKGDEAPKVNGGGNPMANESLIARLAQHYEEIKAR